MPGIDYFGKPMFTNQQLGATMWQNRDGSTILLNPSQFVEVLSIQKQISQAQAFREN